MKAQIEVYNFSCPDISKTPLSVFYIDDSPADTWLAVKILEITGVVGELLTSTNGEEGFNCILDYYAKNKKLPDAIIADLQMPRMGGFELLKKLKELPYYSEEKTTFILITAGLDEEDDQKISEMDIKHILLKPLEPEDLLKKLTKF